MIEIFLSLPVMAIAMVIQLGVLGQFRLLHGSADLIMLIIIAWSLNRTTKYSWLWALAGGAILSFVSAVPAYGYIWTYLLIWLVIQFLTRRVWQMPVIMMLLMTIFGTVLSHLVTYALLLITGVTLNIQETAEQILYPSLIINLLLAIPVYSLFSDIVRTIYPDEEDL